MSTQGVMVIGGTLWALYRLWPSLYLQSVAFLESDEGVDDVHAELKDGYENGVTAVPTYVFNRAWAVPGAQDPETFAKVLQKMAEKALEESSA